VKASPTNVNAGQRQVASVIYVLLVSDMLFHTFSGVFNTVSLIGYPMDMLKSIVNQSVVGPMYHPSYKTVSEYFICSTMANRWLQNPRC